MKHVVGLTKNAGESKCENFFIVMMMMIYRVKCLNACRVLTVYGSDDENIPIDDVLMFDKMIPNHKLHIIQGANHVYSSHQHALASVAVSFIKQSLQQLYMNADDET